MAKETKRRKKGSGTIVKLPSGNYRAELNYTDANGVKQRFRDVAPTEKGAQRLLEKFQRMRKQQDKAMTADIANITLEYYCREIFLPYKESQHREDSTLKRTKSTLNQHVLPAHGNKILSKITYADINALLQSKFGEGFSHSTISKIYTLYGEIFNLAVARKDLAADENPMNLVNMIPKKKFNQRDDTSDIKWMNYEEIQLFTETALTMNSYGQYVYHYGPALAFVLNTGLRASEVCALRRDEISFDKNIVSINHGVSLQRYVAENGEEKYRHAIRSTKVPNSVRIFPMSDKAAELAHIVMDQMADKYMFIVDIKGELVTPSNLNKQVSSICKRAGIGQFTPHSLRHTFVSVLFDKGIDLHTIAALIGDDEATVRRTYLHLFQERKAKAIEVLNISV